MGVLTDKQLASSFHWYRKGLLDTASELQQRGYAFETDQGRPVDVVTGNLRIFKHIPAKKRYL